MSAGERPREWAGADEPSARALRELIGVGPFAARGRAALAWLFASRALGRGSVGLALRSGGAVYVDRSTVSSDFAALRELFVPRKNPYLTRYEGAAVVDVGAHKGYFGAFALLAGARSVVSYEPASANFEALARAAGSFARLGRRWLARKAAVGADAGEAVLVLSAESWTHSLGTLSETGPACAVATEPVEVVAAADVLVEAAREAAGARLIVKIDAEGAECDICLRTARAAWAHVDELFVETHDAAPCEQRELLGALGEAGLVRAPARPAGGSVLHLVRAGGELSRLDRAAARST
jgi:FkbM family methyltransferase